MVDTTHHTDKSKKTLVNNKMKAQLFLKYEYFCM